MSSTVGPFQKKSLYKEQADAFIIKKQALAEAAPIPSKPTAAVVKKWAVLEFISSVIQKIFSTAAPVEKVSEDAHVTKDLQPCKSLPPEIFALVFDPRALDTSPTCVSSTVDYMATILAKNKPRFASLGLDTDAFIKRFAFSSAVAHDLEEFVKNHSTLSKEEKKSSGKQKEAFLQDLQKIAVNIATTVKGLSPGERVLLPGGWTEQALLYEVIRDNNGSYRLAIYNTGQHLNHHPSILHGLKEKHQGYLEIENISAEKICSSSFYKTLLEIRYLPMITTAQEEKIEGSSELYLGLLASLGGNKKTFDKGHLTYRSSDASSSLWKGMMEVLRQSCTSYQQYRRLKYLVQCQTLADFAHFLQSTSVQGPIDIPLKEKNKLQHLFKVKAQKIAHSLVKSYDKGWISQKELEEGLHLIEKLKLPSFSNPTEAGVIKETGVIKEAPLTQKEPAYLHETYYLPNFITGSGIDGGMPEFPDLDFKDITKLSTQLDHYYALFKDKGKMGSTALRAMEVLSENIMKLPLPLRGAQDTWDHLPQGEIQKTIEQLGRLVRLCAYLTAGDNHQLGCPPQALLSVLHLVAIMDKLTKRSVESKLPKAPLYAGFTQLFKSVGFILPTKELQDYRRGIEAYFDSLKDLENPHNCLFSFAGKAPNQKEGSTPFAMFNDFCKGEPPKHPSKEYFLDKKYLDERLHDSVTLEKLHAKGIFDKRDQIRALIEDCDGTYLPLVDARLKEAALLSNFMQKKLLPASGNLPTDSDSSYSHAYHLDKLLKDVLLSPSHGQGFFSDFINDLYTKEYGVFTVSTMDEDGHVSHIQAQILVDKKEDKKHSSLFSWLVGINDKPSQSEFNTYDHQFWGRANLWRTFSSKEKTKAALKAPPLVYELSHIKVVHSSNYVDRLVLEEKKDLSHDVVLQDHKKDTKLSAEETLHVRLMNVDQPDAPWRLLSFLEEHFNAFQERGIQTLLIAYLYHPVVTTLLQEQPLFIEKCKNQALRAYEIYKQDGDVQTASFLLQYLKRMEGRYEELFKNTLPFDSIDYAGKFLSLEPFVKNNSHRDAIAIAKGLLHYQNALLGKPFTEALAQDVLRATFAIQNRYEAPENDSGTQLHRQELRYLQTHYRKEIAAYLDNLTPQQRTLLLNTLLGDSASLRQWEGTYPDYTVKTLKEAHADQFKKSSFHSNYISEKIKKEIALEGHSYTEEIYYDIVHYNVVRGEITKNKNLIGKKREPLSDEILKEYGLPPGTLPDAEDTYYSPDQRKRLIRGYDSKLICQHSFDNKWYGWSSNSASLATALAAFNLSNVHGYYFNPSHKSFFLTNEKKEPLYEVTYKKYSDDPKDQDFYTIETITKRVGNKAYHLVNPKDALEDSSLQSVELLASTRPAVWKEDGANRFLLEFNQGLLSFEKREDNQYYCLQHQGYCLANSKEESLSGFVDYIHLTHPVSGKEKIVAFSSDSHMHVFNLDKQGLPIVKTSKECLYLSYAALLATHYENASLYLSRAEEMGKLDQPSITQLNTILQIPDNHPDAIHCKMKALYLLKKDLLFFESTKDPKEKETQAKDLLAPHLQLYITYLNTCGKGVFPPLPLSFEKLLWRNLSQELLEKLQMEFPLLEKRQKQLQGMNTSLAEGVIKDKKELPPLKSDAVSEVLYNSESLLPYHLYHLLNQQPSFKKQNVATPQAEDLIENRDLLPFLGAGKSFQAHFIDFYKEAKAGSKTLLPRLEAMRAEQNSTNCALAALLENVLENRNKFPEPPQLDGDLNQVNQALRDWSVKVRNAYQPPQLSLVQRVKAFATETFLVIRMFLKQKWPKISALLERFIKWIKSWSGPKLHLFIKDIKGEASGKSSTTQYHHQAAEPKKLLPLALTQEMLFSDPIAKVETNLLPQLEGKLASSKKAMKALEEDALKLAAKLPQDNAIAYLIRMKRFSGEESTLTIEDLISLFIVGQAGPYLEETYLTQTDLAQLELTIGQYLQKKILSDHAEACIDLHKEYTQAAGDDKKYLETKLLALVNEKPQYEPKDHREFLVFEAMAGVRLRKEQREKLSLLSSTERNSIVLHMIMGAGKSAVITPIAALLMARKGFLPVVVVPDSLYQTGKENTKQTVFKSFGKHAHAFECHRESDFSKETLQTLLESLKHWKEEKGFIYTTRESLLSFLLKAKELFYQYEETQGIEAKADLKESITFAWDILKELKQGGAALFDEAHSLLNPRDELNFTFGKATRVNPTYATFIYEILQFLTNDPQMQALIDLKHNNQAKMSPETYTNIVKPILIDRLVKKFQVPKEYFYDAVDHVPASVQQHPEKDLIALGKAVVSLFLPHTLSKKSDEHYGFGSRANFAIPYLGNNTPNEKAEFASYVETLLYTGYQFIQKELSSEQLRTFRQESIVKSRQEQIVSKKQIQDTKANILFKKVTGQDLSETFDEDKAKAYIHAHPDGIFDYCLAKVTPDIVTFPKKLSANPHHLTALFKEVDAMTGTPWNKDAYPAQFKTEEDKSVDETCSNIIRSIPPERLLTLEGDHDAAIFENIIETFRQRPGCRALIDAGALVKNISNEAVAQKLLEASDPAIIDGIAYYDTENELQVLERATMKPVLFKDSMIPKERRVTFYDQRHTFGSDIPQQRDAEALLTLSETLKKFEEDQAMYRMREVDKGQTLTLLIPKRILPLIDKDKKITPEKILDFVKHNQKQQELDDNLRSRKIEIKTIVETAIHDAFMQAKTFEEQLAIFSKTKDFLMQSTDVTPFEAFGGIDKEEDSYKILQSYAENGLKMLDTLEKNKAIKDASTYKAKITSLKPIPVKPTSRRRENSNIDTQVENQVEMQVQLTVATQASEYKEGIKPWTVWQWPASLNIFKDEWMKPANAYWFWQSPAMPLYRAQDLLQVSRSSKVSQMKGVFNDTFLVSNNFLPQKRKEWTEIQAEPFAWYAKPVYHLVVVEEPNGQIKTLMIDQNDLSFFRDKLLKDTGSEARKICIYDPVVGITLQGKKGFNEQHLKENKEFIKHLVYAKFWNGISSYTEEEADYLKSWIQSNNIDKMYHFFQEITRNKEDSAKAFSNSVLALVFADLYKQKGSSPHPAA